MARSLIDNVRPNLAVEGIGRYYLGPRRLSNVFHKRVTVPRRKSPCERIFKTTYLAKLLYNNYVINYKAIKIFKAYIIYKI